MTLTAKQISDLNGSNEAMRLGGVGTLLSSLEGRNSVASGSVTPTDGEREVVATGLSTVSHATVSLSGSPSGYHMSSTVTAGSVAGTIIIQSWTATDVDDTTPKSASVAWSSVEWVAVGTE